MRLCSITVLVWLTLIHSASALPSNIKDCVLTTARDIQQASSAAELKQRLLPRIHAHILGSRTYKNHWTTILQQNKVALAVERYVEALYYRALKDSAAYDGQSKTIIVEAVTRTTRPWNSYDNGRKRLTAYHVQVTISPANPADAVTVIVMTVAEDGRCKFGDIAILSGNTETWFSNNVDVRSLNLTNSR